MKVVDGVRYFEDRTRNPSGLIRDESCERPLDRGMQEIDKLLQAMIKTPEDQHAKVRRGRGGEGD